MLAPPCIRNALLIREKKIIRGKYQSPGYRAGSRVELGPGQFRPPQKTKYRV